MSPSVNEVALSELMQQDRWEAEFFHPRYRVPAAKDVDWKPIGEVLTKCQYGSSLSLNEDDRGYPIFRLNEIKKGLLTTPKKYVEIPDTHYNRLKLELDDVLFCRTNGNPHMVGRTGMLKEPTDACFASYLIRIRTRADELLPEYLTVYLNTPVGRLQIERRATRSNQVNLSAAQILRVLVPIPRDPTAQQTVADLFDKHADLTIEARRLYRQAAEELDWELGISTLAAPSSQLSEVPLSELWLSKRWDSEYFRPRILDLVAKVASYPGGCESLLDQASFVPSKWSPSLGSGEFQRYVELADIAPEVALIDKAEELPITDLPGRARRELLEGDVIVSSVAGSSDKAALVDRTFNGVIASNGFLQFRSRSSDPHFLVLLIRSLAIRTQLEREATGGCQWPLESLHLWPTESIHARSPGSFSPASLI